ncbi:histidine phosphatase family protein [Streptomyces sp. NPDC001037]|uniref:histidine phosphatase family protein n=1 Tax=Streptomyces sp. NPDC001037 TaxID=3364542 RepID=UPI0036CF1ADC
MTIRLTFLSTSGGDPVPGTRFGDASPGERDLAAARAARADLPAHTRAVRAPSLRSRRTAEALGLAAAYEPALRDLDLGVWCGRTADEVAAAEPHAFSAWLTDPDAAPHGGESVRRFCRRTADWLDAVADEPGHVLAVTEPAVVRAALVHALAAPARAFWRFDVPPLTPVSLTWQHGHWDVGMNPAASGPPRRFTVIHQGPHRQAGRDGAHALVPSAGAWAHPLRYPRADGAGLAFTFTGP